MNNCYVADTEIRNRKSRWELPVMLEVTEKSNRRRNERAHFVFEFKKWWLFVMRTIPSTNMLQVVLYTVILPCRDSFLLGDWVYK